MNNLPIIGMPKPEWRMLLGFVHCPPAPVLSILDGAKGMPALVCSKCATIVQAEIVIQMLQHAATSWEERIKKAKEAHNGKSRDGDVDGGEVTEFAGGDLSEGADAVAIDGETAAI